MIAAAALADRRAAAGARLREALDRAARPPLRAAVPPREAPAGRGIRRMRRAVDLSKVEIGDAAGDDAFAGRGRAARRALDGGRILREPQEARVPVAALGVEEAADLVVA